MPSTVQQTNGSVSPITQQANGSLKPYTNGGGGLAKNNGHADEYQDHDAFQHLPKPQQDVLLLHGPRQRYSLQTTGQIPELRSEREILIQVH